MNFIKKYFLALPAIFRNIFFLTFVVFAIWMIFFDENNLLVQYQRRKELSALLQKKKFFIKEINDIENQYTEITTNKSSQEKFARENFWMKRDNEDVYVFADKK